MPTASFRLLCAAILGLVTAPALAQEQGPPSPPATPTPPALGGPTVPREVARTIVRRDAKGNFQRVEGRPEEAALVALDLDEATRQRAREAVTARAMAIAGVLIDNIDLVRERGEDMEANRRDHADALLRQLYEKAEP